MRYEVKFNRPRYSVIDRSMFGRPKLVRLEDTFVAEYRGEKFELEEGFVTDGASIPMWLTPICGSRFKYPRVIAAIVHDALYGGIDPECSRAEADDLYRDLQIAMGVPRWKAYVEWAALRAFGSSHWAGARDLATFVLAASLLALCAGCQTTLDKTRNGEVSGAVIDDGGFKAGTVELQSVAQGESAVLATYTEDASLFSPGHPTRDLRLTVVGDAVKFAPEIFSSLCDAFKIAKEAKSE